MLLVIFFSAVIAFAANVYKNILAHEEVLNFWFRYGAKFQDKWFWKPVWGCELCIAGQWALWYYIFRLICDRFGAGLNIFWLMGQYPKLDYSLAEGLIFVLTAIGFSKLFSRILSN